MTMTATTIHTKNGTTSMVYHNTEVATMSPWVNQRDSPGVNNKVTVTLDTGGWVTKTTKKRMNQFAQLFDLPFMVYQEKGELIVEVLRGNNPATYVFDDNGSMRLVLEW